MEEERLVTRTILPEEERVETALRPSFLTDYIGQDAAREKLEIFIEAAKRRGEALDHTLLSGPPGLGKTTLATVSYTHLTLPTICSV